METPTTVDPTTAMMKSSGGGESGGESDGESGDESDFPAVSPTKSQKELHKKRIDEKKKLQNEIDEKRERTKTG